MRSSPSSQLDFFFLRLPDRRDLFRDLAPFQNQYKYTCTPITVCMRKGHPPGFMKQLQLRLLPFLAPGSKLRLQLLDSRWELASGTYQSSGGGEHR